MVRVEPRMLKSASKVIDNLTRALLNGTSSQTKLDRDPVPSAIKKSLSPTLRVVRTPSEFTDDPKDLGTAINELLPRFMLLRAKTTISGFVGLSSSRTLSPEKLEI